MDIFAPLRPISAIRATIHAHYIDNVMFPESGNSRMERAGRVRDNYLGRAGDIHRMMSTVNNILETPCG